MNARGALDDPLLISVRTFSDVRGTLGVLEAESDAGFDIARVYWLRGLEPDSPRGFHAHLRTRQIALCLSGSCRILLCDPDGSERWIPLTAGGEAVRIEPLVWHEMHDFSADCTLLVLADRRYDEADYIRDREDWERARLG
jgi:dTDP-4-dehydrorhamnose 3,5-epimerase-like enzyme